MKDAISDHITYALGVLALVGLGLGSFQPVTANEIPPQGEWNFVQCGPNTTDVCSGSGDYVCCK